MRSKHSIEELLNQFDIPNQDIWWQRVEREIGDNRKAFIIEPGLELLPLPKKQPSREPIIWNSNQDWKIVESMGIDIWDQEHKQEYFDIDEFVLHLHQKSDLERYPEEYSIGSLSSQIPAHLLSQAMTITKFANRFVQIVPLEVPDYHLLNTPPVDFHWRYAHTGQAVTPTERLTSLLEQLDRHLSENPDQTEHWRIYVDISEAFFTQIAELRALKILILNLWQAHDLNPKMHPQIYAIIRPDEKKDLYTNLIRSTSQALSAVIGGIDALCFESDTAIPSDTSLSKEYRRLSRNIHYILKHEAHLNHRIDPLCGSLHIEALTEALATKTWTNLGGMDPKKSVK